MEAISVRELSRLLPVSTSWTRRKEPLKEHMVCTESHHCLECLRGDTRRVTPAATICCPRGGILGALVPKEGSERLPNEVSERFV